jgi:iron complex outermembrane receptor protein
MRPIVFKPYVLSAAITAAIVPMAKSQTLETLEVRGVAPTSTTGETTHTKANFVQGARIDPSEIMFGIPGLQVDSRTNYAQDSRLSLRGFGARSAFGVRGVDLLVDGVPYSMPDGQGQLGSIMLDDIDSVTVITGPIASLYGNASGGVVSLTRSPVDDTSFRLNTRANDQGFYQVGAKGHIKKEQLALAASVSSSQLDSDRPHAEGERRQASIRAAYQGQGPAIAYTFDVSDDPRLDDPLGLTPDQFADNPYQPNPLTTRFDTHKQVNHQQHSLQLSDELGSGFWKLSGWSGTRDMVQLLGFAGDGARASGGIVNLDREFYGMSAVTTQFFSVATLPMEWSLGAEYASMNDDRQGFVNNQGAYGDLRRDELGQARNSDVHTLIRTTLNSGVQLYGGARYSHIEMSVDDHYINAQNPDDSGRRAFSNHSWALGADYPLNNALTASVSVGEGFETPTLTEMAYAPDADGLNLGLHESKNQQQQISLAWAPSEKNRTTLTLFSIDTRNELVVATSDGGRTSYRNESSSERRGIEVSTTHAITDRIQWRLGGTWVDATMGSDVSVIIPGVAKTMVQNAIRWDALSNDRLTVELTAQWRDSIYADDTNLIKAPSYTLVDVSFSGQLSASQKIRWWLRLNNLTDEQYVGSVVVNQSNGRAFEPGLSRHVSVGLEWAL